MLHPATLSGEHKGCGATPTGKGESWSPRKAAVLSGVLRRVCREGTSGVKARGDRLHSGDLWSLPSCALTPPESVLRAPKCPGQTAAWPAGLPAGFRRAKLLTGNSSCCSVKRTMPASYGILDFLVAGEGIGNPLQCSCLENPMDGRAWWAAVHGVAKSQTRLSDFTFTFHFHALEKEMAAHSSVLAWRIPGIGEPGGLPWDHD